MIAIGKRSNFKNQQKRDEAEFMLKKFMPFMRCFKVQLRQ